MYAPQTFCEAGQQQGGQRCVTSPSLDRSRWHPHGPPNGAEIDPNTAPSHGNAELNPPTQIADERPPKESGTRAGFAPPNAQVGLPIIITHFLRIFFSRRHPSCGVVETTGRRESRQEAGATLTEKKKNTRRHDVCLYRFLLLPISYQTYMHGSSLYAYTAIAATKGQ